MVYKVILIRILEVEICIPPLNIYLDSRVAAFRQRLKILGTGRVIERACERLRTRFRNRRGQAWHPYLRHRYCIAIPRY